MRATEVEVTFTKYKAFSDGLETGLHRILIIDRANCSVFTLSGLALYNCYKSFIAVGSDIATHLPDNSL